MPLTPETTDALKQALDAVVAEAGNDPKYTSLVDGLQAATTALDELHTAPADATPAPNPDAPHDAAAHDTPAADAAGDSTPDAAGDSQMPDTFDAAQKALGDRMKAKRKAGA